MKPFVARPRSATQQAEKSRYICTRIAARIRNAFGALSSVGTGAACAGGVDATDSSSWLFAPLGAVLVIVAVGWAAMHFLRHRRQNGHDTAGALKVIAATGLGAHERAVLLRAGNRVFLLGVTPQHVTLLSELDVKALNGQAVDASAGSNNPS